MAKANKATKGGNGAGGGEIATAVQLAAHLDCARSYLDKLESSGVIQREPDGGFNLAASRTSYIRYLRRERMTTHKGSAEAAFLKAKTTALEVRTAQKLGELFPKRAALDIIDTFVGACTVEIQSLAARVAPTDLSLRRRIDAQVLEVRKAISGRIAEKARQAMPEVAADAAD